MFAGLVEHLVAHSARLGGHRKGYIKGTSDLQLIRKTDDAHVDVVAIELQKPSKDTSAEDLLSPEQITYLKKLEQPNVRYLSEQ